MSETQRHQELIRQGRAVVPWPVEDPIDPSKSKDRYYPVKGRDGKLDQYKTAKAQEANLVPTCDHTHWDFSEALDCAEETLKKEQVNG